MIAVNMERSLAVYFCIELLTEAGLLIYRGQKSWAGGYLRDTIPHTRSVRR